MTLRGGDLRRQLGTPPSGRLLELVGDPALVHSLHHLKPLQNCSKSLGGHDKLCASIDNVRTGRNPSPL